MHSMHRNEMVQGEVETVSVVGCSNRRFEASYDERHQQQFQQKQDLHLSIRQ